MIDGGLWNVIRPRLMQSGWHAQRIETGGTGLGVPDTNLCLDGHECWMELKYTSTHALSTLTVEQVSWLWRRARAGGRVFLATRRQHEGGSRKGPAVDELWLHRGEDARLLKTEGLRGAEPLLVTAGGPAEWNWDLFESLLLGRA